MEKIINLPNAITLGRTFLLPFIVYFIFLEERMYTVVSLALFLFFDALDGLIARLTKTVTRFGTYFDHTVDFFAVVLLFCTFFLTKKVDLVFFSVFLGMKIVFPTISYVFTKNRVSTLRKLSHGVLVALIFYLLFFSQDKIAWFMLSVSFLLSVAHCAKELYASQSHNQ